MICKWPKCCREHVLTRWIPYLCENKTYTSLFQIRRSFVLDQSHLFRYHLTCFLVVDASWVHKCNTHCDSSDRVHRLVLDVVFRLMRAAIRTKFDAQMRFSERVVLMLRSSSSSSSEDEPEEHHMSWNTFTKNLRIISASMAHYPRYHHHQHRLFITTTSITTQEHQEKTKDTVIKTESTQDFKMR